MKSAFFRSQLRLLKPFVAKCSLGVVRRTQDKLGTLMANLCKEEVGCEYITVGSMKCAMLTPKEILSGGVILYLHGGGYVAGNLDYAKGFGTVLATRFGIRVFCVEYRLAPENPYPAALDDAMESYGHLLSSGFEPSRIVLCGESAGGGMCYSLCQKLRDKGRTIPAGIIAISPWTDLTASGESYVENEKKDPSMTVERLKYFADCYVYGATRERGKIHPCTNSDAEADRLVKSEPRLSPLFDTQAKMPESLIFVGGDEIMLDDARKMHDRLIAAGAKSELTIAPGMWHGYILYNLAERECDFEKIGKFLKKIVPIHKKLAWMTLDNAAKIFPAARRRYWSNMFRLSATLNEPVDRDVLTVALDVTLRRFPSIAVRIKAGAFWYYLEELPEAPEIQDEKPYPLSGMSFADMKKCAFRVLVYENRIAVELFHALTDGNGALMFLKTLVSEYLYQKHGVKVPTGGGILDRLEEPAPDELEDSFLKYAGKYPASRRDTDAYRIAGKREVDGFRTNTTFVIDAEYVVAEAKRRGVTVTAYMTAVLIEASRRVQEKRVPTPRKYKPIKIHVPVNLRKIFPSKTMRNFVLYATLGIDPRLGEYSFDELCSIASSQMKLQITEKNMAAMIKTNVDSERSILLRAVPLFLKDIVMKLVFNAVGERKSCFCFSNLGVVKTPEEFSNHVDRLDFVLGSQSAAPYNTSAITFGGKMYLNIIRNMKEPVLEREIYAVLRELGVPHTAESNTRGSEKNVLY